MLLFFFFIVDVHEMLFIFLRWKLQLCCHIFVASGVEEHDNISDFSIL